MFRYISNTSLRTVYHAVWPLQLKYKVTFDKIYRMQRKGHFTFWLKPRRRRHGNIKMSLRDCQILTDLSHNLSGMFNCSTDPDGNSPPRSTTRNNVSWAENSYVLQLDDTQQDDITPTHYTLPAPFIFKLMQMVGTNHFLYTDIIIIPELQDCWIGTENIYNYVPFFQKLHTVKQFRRYKIT